MTFSLKFLVPRGFVVALALGGLLTSAVTHAEVDPALLGCWRSQHIQLTFADGKSIQQNADCTLFYEAGRSVSRCGATSYSGTSLYEVPSPGKLRISLVDPQGKAGAPADLTYRVDDRWLVTQRVFDAKAPDAQDRPRQLDAVSIRVPGATDSEKCKPRGDTGLRIGRTPVSSLTLTPPAGWQPLLVDPAQDKALGSAVNRSFLVGAFIPAGTLPGTPRTEFILVLDDTRPGPKPVRAAEFAAVRKQFAQELGKGGIRCDGVERACGLLRQSGGQFVYTELVPVMGRVVMVSGTSSGDPARVQAAVRQFTEQLARDNP
jgi:hypothetical protein